MAVEVYTPELRVVNAENEMVLNLDSIQGLWTHWGLTWCWKWSAPMIRSATPS